MVRDWMLRLRSLFNRATVERELEDELRFHLERQVEVYRKAGLSYEDGVRRARIEFGGLDQIKEEYRDALGVRLIQDAWRDARYAIRALRRTPAFTLTAIVSLALGVGANTLVFSIVNAVVLKPLPVHEPDRVVFVQRTGPFISHSFPEYRDMRDRAVMLDGLAGYRITMMDVATDANVAHEWGYLATGNYFDVLGLTPAAGRFFHQSDDLVPGSSPFVVLSYDYWQKQFGGNSSIVGSTIRINRLAYTVLGVTPAGFYGTEIFYRPHLWVPMMMQAEIEVGNPWLENRNTSNTWVIGRLKPGVTVAQAESHLNAIASQVARENGRRGEARIKLTRPGLVGDAFGGPARAFALAVLVLAGLVLVTACANLASTLAARGADRQRELAIRLSIGASRGRIIRQLLTETVVLSLVGGVAGAVAAAVAARALSSWQLPIALPVQFDVEPDARVFVFALIVSTLAGVAFGLAPARQAGRTDSNAALKSVDGARGRRWPIRDVLVAVQVALCFALVAACLISLRGLQHALTMPLGFQPKGITMAGFDLGLAGYVPEHGEALRKRILDRVSALPGVESAAYSSSVPLSVDQSTTNVLPADRAIDPTETLRAVRYEVSPGFFRTLSIRMQGRDIDWRDNARGPRVAVVNEAFVRRILQTASGVGRHFRYGLSGPPVEIIGVVEDGKYRYLTEPDTPVVFQPILQRYNTTTVMLVRSALPSNQIAGELRQIVASLDSSMPLFGVGSMEQMLGFALFPMRAAAIALGGFGALAILLAATGIHGLVAYAVARRQREIAIRVAIGATRATILRLVLNRIAVLVGAGATAGLLLALAVGPLLTQIVYDAAPRDPFILGVVAFVVVLVGALSCWAPARRSLYVQPTSALHVE